MFQKKKLEKIKTHFIFKNFFPKIASFRDNVEKSGRSGQATDDNTVR
jgi:hypothetical protein